MYTLPKQFRHLQGSHWNSAKVHPNTVQVFSTSLARLFARDTGAESKDDG